MGAKDMLLAAAVAGMLLTGLNSAFPQDWVQTSAPTANWTSVACSADGKRLVATGSGLVYVSTNAGVTWTPTSAPVTNWIVVASSADGSRLLVAAGGYDLYSPVFISTNVGATWSDAGTFYGLSAAASSADGNTLVIAGASIAAGYILTSTNAGTTWVSADISQTGNQVWRSSAVSANGQKLVVVGGVGNSFGAAGTATSTNGGATWVGTNTAVRWRAVACSADATRLVAGGNAPIYMSQDFGITWTPATTPAGGIWISVASSADGTRLVAVEENESMIYTSTNAGVNWEPTAAPATNWSSVASSADGCKLFAAVNGGGIWTSQTTPKPVLNLTPAESGFLISWVVPSMPFVLQENPDLTTTNWTDVTTVPKLNFTNLHHELSLPVSSANRFYRLKSL